MTKINYVPQYIAPVEDASPNATQLLGAISASAARVFDVMAFGAKGDGVTDDTTAIQAAITAATAVNGKVWFPIPSAEYLTGALTVGTAGSYNTCSFVGEAADFQFNSTTSRGVVLKLKDSTNGTMFTVAASNASDVGPGPVTFENLWLKGNRTNQSGTSYAVTFTSHTASSNKQRSGYFKRVRIQEFRSGGVLIGTLRNAGVMDQVVILDIGASGSGVGSAINFGSAADWRFINCDFGNCEGAAVQDSGSGPSFFTQCNFFTALHGYKADTSSLEKFFENCSFDRNNRYGAYISPSSAKMFSFSGCRFSINSQETNATYSDLYVGDDSNVTLVGCVFPKGGVTVTNFPAYHVETAGTTDGVVLAGCKFESTAAGAITNDFTKIRQFGSDVILLPNGTAGAPSYAFDADSGMYRTAGSLGFTINGFAQMFISEVASATRQLQLKAGTGDTTAAPILTVTGGTNTDLRLAGAGTGVLSFGTWTSNGDAAVNGYVTIKDSGGTTRKLATIA